MNSLATALGVEKLGTSCFSLLGDWIEMSSSLECMCMYFDSEMVESLCLAHLCMIGVGSSSSGSQSVSLAWNLITELLAAEKFSFKHLPRFLFEPRDYCLSAR